MCPSSTSSSDAAAAAAVDDLIVLPPARATEGFGRVVAGFCVAVFGLAILGTAVVDLTRPRPRPALEGLEKEADEARRAAASWRDGSAERLFEDDLRLASRTRAFVGEPYTLQLYLRLGEAKGRVVVGRDGVLFLGDRVKPRPESDAAILGTAEATLSALDRRLAALGVRAIFLPVPRKEFVCAASLPANVNARTALDRGVVEGLRRRGVATADLVATFSAVPPEEVYHRADSHWTPYAEKLAAEAAVALSGRAADPATYKTTLRKVGRQPASVDLLRFIGLEVETIRGRPELTGEADDYKVVDAKRRPAKPGVYGPADDVAIVGTSFTARRDLPMFLAHLLQKGVRNAAEAGADPIGPLIKLFERRADPRPSLLFVEIPNHFLFRIDPLPLLGNFFAAAAPDATSDVAPGVVVDVARAFVRASFDLGGRRIAATVPPGRLVHSGDGVVALRLRGELSGGDAEVDLETDSFAYKARWKSGAEEVVLPLIGVGPTREATAKIRKAPGSGAARLRLSSATLVTDGVLGAAIELEPSAPTSTGAGWEIVLPWPAAAPTPDRGALVLEFDAAVPAGASVSCEVVDGASTRPWPTAPSFVVDPAVVAVMGVGDLAGRTPTAIRLRGTGTPPGSVLRAARVVAPRAASRK